MRYYFIDKVVCLEANRSLTAVKNVALSEDVYSDHFFGNPIMPGALQIEVLAQAGTILLEVSNYLRYKAILVMVEKAKFRNLVRPGDQLRVHLNIDSIEDGMAKAYGEIVVSDKKVADCRMVFSLQPIDEYYSPRLKILTRIMYENFLRGTDLKGIDDFWRDVYWKQDE